MRVTNKLNLPEAIVSAVMNDDYSRGVADISVTELIKPPQMRALELHFEDQIVEDASDRIWSLMGQVAHGVLERADSDPTVAVERRLMTEVRGWVVSGRMDRLTVYPNGLIQDYKVTSVWSVVLEGGKAKSEWVEQLNAYAVLCRRNGIAVTQLQIVAILRDWSKLEAKRRPRDYPRNQVVVLDVPVWSEADALTFIKGRVAAHQEAERLRAEGALATLTARLPCTAEDRWAKPTTFAVMKAGRKSALKVQPSLEAAYAWALAAGFATHETDPELGGESAIELKARITIVKRLGASTRCESYCAVRDFCPQYAAMKAQGEADGDDTQEEAA